MKHRITNIMIFAVLVFAAITSSRTAAAQVKVDYIYNLATFEGEVPYSGARLFVDNKQDEVYVCYGDGVSIFSPSGMEVYTFGDGGELGSVGGGAVDKDGNIFLLTLHYLGGGKTKNELTLCNYRGEPITKVALKGIPPEFGDFSPEKIVRNGDRLYLADLTSMKVVVADRTGKYLDSYDIASILGLSAKKVADSGMSGFNVDKDGNLFFTISVFFQAYKLTPDRKLSSWGAPGGAPGKFNVVTDIATDDKGNIYVVDTLKAAVQVFDKDFHFVTQFGGRGWDPGDLIAPQGIVIDSKGMAYVSQSANRGVNVYKITD